RPNQTPAAWLAELEQAIALAADHLSLYQLTIEPQTGFGALAALGKLPTLPDEEAVELYFLTQDVMEAAGLPAYEISNHAKAGAESRHNLIYWRGGAWIGIGPGAHGRLPAGNGKRIATESEKLPEKWLSLVRERGSGLSSDVEVRGPDQAKEALLMGLRLAEGVALDRIEHLDAALLDHRRIAELSEQGFLARRPDRLLATATGRPVLNRLIAEIVRDPT
ncbi:MAG TPA: coproporphyrinogen III oxidase, partial [Alphaproteobacteria bacterium]|nr:coproporphyrinogen III oxidase [Alphaproteobacteria bacterium]